MSALWFLIITVIPKSFLSRLWGVFSRIRFPRFLMLPILRKYAGMFGVNLDEAELPLENYTSLNQFFMRSLRKGVRPVDASERTVVSPVDGVLTRYGAIQQGRLIQAKGIDYAMQELLDWPEHTESFLDGFFMVLYLSPKDYHRIHNPFEGDVLGYAHSPGKLFPVNDWAANNLKNLFGRNERLTTLVQTAYGKIAAVKVGALNVGHIRVVYDDIRTNRWFQSKQRQTYANPVPLERGAELGRFEMGSTVVLLFEKGKFMPNPELSEGQTVRFGQAIGKL